jgi:hypothetical protein
MRNALRFFSRQFSGGRGFSPDVQRCVFEGFSPGSFSA